jgi:hypothetical protein
MIENIRFILSLLPAIIRAVKEIEAVLPEAGLGELKLRLVRESLESAVDQVSELWPLLEKLIGLVVKIFNDAGLFKKSQNTDEA